MKTSQVTKFEKVFARQVRAKHAFAFWNARTASYSILRGLGVGAGDEVIVSAYTCWSVVTPILAIGARPIYVDIDPLTLGIDYQRVAEAVSPKTRALIVQHTFGRRSDIPALRHVLAEHDLPLIEDATHCAPETSSEQASDTGTSAAYWSFGWSKAIVLGRGGMATTNDPALAAFLNEMSFASARPSRTLEISTAFYKAVNDAAAHPRLRLALSSIYLLLSRFGAAPDGERFVLPDPADGVSLRSMGSLQARAGIAATLSLDAQIEHRRKLTRTYDQVFSARGWPATLSRPIEDPLLLYPIRVRNRDELMRAARSKFLDIRAWWTSPLALPREAASTLLYSAHDFPRAIAAYEQILLMPTDPRVSVKEAERLADCVIEVGVPASHAAQY